MTLYDDTRALFLGVATSRVDLNLDSARRQLARKPHYAERIRALEDILAIRYELKRPRGKKARNPVLPIAWYAVVDDACARHGVHRKDVLAGWKVEKASWCRYEIWWALHHVRGRSLSEIGRRFGYHHTSIMYGVNLWQAGLDEQRTAAIAEAA